MFSSKRIDGPDEMGALFTYMVDLGITDGLPVIPPTEQNVQAMIDYVGLSPDAEVAVIPPGRGVATIEKLAINAVMAGCLPEYFPVVIAATRALGDPRFGLLGIQTTTNPVSPVLVINGPIRHQIGVNCGRGCMGPGFRANATIGRAVKLALLNIGDCRPGDISKSIHGMPGRFTFCFGELEEDSPWDPFHVDMGFRREQSTVSVFGGQGTTNMMVGFTKPEEIVCTVADGMRYYSCTAYLRGTGLPMIVMGPGHAKIFGDAGWDKKRIKQELFKLTAIPLSSVPQGRQITAPVYENWERSRSINLCRDAADIVILVAGGPEPYHLVYIPGWAHPKSVVTEAVIIPQH